MAGRREKCRAKLPVISAKLEHCYSVLPHVFLLQLSPLLFCRPWDKDRYMAADIESAIELVHEGKVS